ncbi:hypothetical protein [Streptomyces anulatus]|uniref:amino acid kinase family protein n=1 Tax=Streptomyces anulatus TaxID=1892 RepID=UPI001D18ED85|nr:hypothetical protein [Streptomyces anulatus]
MNKNLGFRDFGVDVLVKLGGSLLADFDRARELGETLSRLAATHRVVVFPGGGPIDNYIEEVDRTLHFPPDIHHQLCARAQDQTGLMFSTLCPSSQVFSRPVEVSPILEEGRVAVMLPMEQIIGLDVFERSWVITSDSMAAWFARFFGARRFAVLTDVPGIRRPGDEDGGYLESLSTTDAGAMGRTSIDECLPPFLEANGMSCTILNGQDHLSVENWLQGRPAPGTTVHPVGAGH